MNQSQLYPPWVRDRDLVDKDAGVMVRIYQRVIPPRYSDGFPVTHRNYQILHVHNGKDYPHFPTVHTVNPITRLSEVRPFPIQALAALLRPFEDEVSEERQMREDAILIRIAQNVQKKASQR